MLPGFQAEKLRIAFRAALPASSTGITFENTSANSRDVGET